jgi:hypothetical protein
MYKYRPYTARSGLTEQTMVTQYCTQHNMGFVVVYLVAVHRLLLLILLLLILKMLLLLILLLLIYIE